MTKPKQEHELRGKRVNVGPKNGNWKGDKVGKRALHERMYKLIPKPDICTWCGNTHKKLELANISQKYLLDPNDWEWLCPSCHFKQDGRIEKWKISSVKDHSKTFCILCGSKDTYIKPNGFPNWYSHGEGFKCKKCYDRPRDRLRWQVYKETGRY